MVKWPKELISMIMDWIQTNAVMYITIFFHRNVRNESNYFVKIRILNNQIVPENSVDAVHAWFYR